MTQPAQPTEQSVDVAIGDVLAEMDPLGRALFDAALGRAQVKVLAKELAELRNPAQKPEEGESHG